MLAGFVESCRTNSKLSKRKLLLCISKLASSTACLPRRVVQGGFLEWLDNSHMHLFRMERTRLMDTFLIVSVHLTNSSCSNMHEMLVHCQGPGKEVLTGPSMHNLHHRHLALLPLHHMAMLRRCPVGQVFQLYCKDLDLEIGMPASNGTKLLLLGLTAWIVGAAVVLQAQEVHVDRCQILSKHATDDSPGPVTSAALSLIHI